MRLKFLNNNQRLKILTWNENSQFLHYLAMADCDFYIPEEKGVNLSGNGNITQIKPFKIKEIDDIDCILFQSRKNLIKDQNEILSEEQRKLPKIYLEFNPPLRHAVDLKHPASSNDILIVNVSHFNDLMWDMKGGPSIVIEPGVIKQPDINYEGYLEKGVVIADKLQERGRRWGYDIFEKIRQEIPLDLVGRGTEQIGGLGPIDAGEMQRFVSKYRFLFVPTRYSGLDMKVLEAMSVGVPVVTLGTTDIGSLISNDVNGFSDNNVTILTEKMRELIDDINLARKLSIGARVIALRRFDIDRFLRDWENVFTWVASRTKRQKVKQRFVEF